MKKMLFALGLALSAPVAMVVGAETPVDVLQKREITEDKFLSDVRSMMNKEDIKMPKDGIKMDTSLDEIFDDKKKKKAFDNFLKDKMGIPKSKIGRKFKAAKTLGDVFNIVK